MKSQNLFNDVKHEYCRSESEESQDGDRTTYMTLNLQLELPLIYVYLVCSHLQFIRKQVSNCNTECRRC